MNYIIVLNCIGVFFFVKVYECIDLVIKVKEIVNSRFIDLCKYQEFLFLFFDKLVEIISDDDINVINEEIVYEVCMYWFMLDKENRMVYLMEIMNCVRFVNISFYYFCDRIDRNKILKDCELLRKVLDIVRYFYMLRNR